MLLRILILWFACCFSVFAMEQNIKVVNDELNRLMESNAIFIEVIGKMVGDGEGFTYIHDKETTRDLLPLNRACNTLFSDAPQKVKLSVRIAAEDELLALAAPSKRSGAFRELVAYPPERFIDYLTPDARFFINPSRATIEFLENYDAMEYLPELKDAEFEDTFVSEYFSQFENGPKAGGICMVMDAFLGILGFETTMKETLSRMRSTIRKANIRKLEDEVNSYR